MRNIICLSCTKCCSRNFYLDNYNSIIFALLSTDDDSIVNSQCFEENEDYMEECIQVSTFQGMTMLLEESSDPDENQIKCA